MDLPIIVVSDDLEDQTEPDSNEEVPIESVPVADSSTGQAVTLYECAKCAELFTSDFFLNQHRLSHRFQCVACHLKFDSALGLQLHASEHRYLELLAQSPPLECLNGLTFDYPC